MINSEKSNGVKSEERGGHSVVKLQTHTTVINNPKLSLLCVLLLHPVGGNLKAALNSIGVPIVAKILVCIVCQL